jgi:hypothetical protein
MTSARISQEGDGHIVHRRRSYVGERGGSPEQRESTPASLTSAAVVWDAEVEASKSYRI